MSGSIRNDIIALFEKHIDLSEIEIKDLEIGIYNFTIDYAGENKIPLSWSCELFQECYMNKVRSMFINKNSIIELVRTKKKLPHEIPYMKPYDLDTNAWADIIQSEIDRNKAAYHINQVAMTDQITCGKCKKKNISYYELQTRSADESLTIFFDCLDCGNKWKC